MRSGLHIKKLVNLKTRNISYFKQLDANHDGEITMAEFRDASRAMGFVEATDEECDAVPESGRGNGRAELRALKRGHLGAYSVRRNWYRSLPIPECGVKAP